MLVNTKHRKISDSFVLSDNPLYGRISQMEPVSVVNTISLTWHKAKGFSVYDKEGNKWIDLTSGIFVANAGHANPLIKKAIKKQLDADLFFAYNYPTEIKEKFLKKLLKLSPDYFSKVILLNSGSEAVEVAYKLIKLHSCKTGKKNIISFRGSYHGRGLSNDFLSGNNKKANWSGLRDKNITFLNFPYRSNDVLDLKKLPRHNDIAGFVIETFQGWGAWFYPKGFLNQICKIAKKNGALICFDEMQSGFYRLGPIYGYMTYGKDIKPDIICLGKGVSSSLPISAVLSREDVVNIDKTADLHGTQSGNSICVAAALANLEFLSDPKQLRRREKTYKVFLRKINEFSDLPAVSRVNVRGMIAGIIFHNSELATRVVKKCIERGVLPVCTNKESIKIAPPLIITEEAIIEALEVVKQAITDETNK